MSEGGREGEVGGGNGERCCVGRRERERGACWPMCKVSCKCEPISVGVHRMCACVYVCVCVHVRGYTP